MANRGGRHHRSRKTDERFAKEKMRDAFVDIYGDAQRYRNAPSEPKCMVIRVPVPSEEIRNAPKHMELCAFEVIMEWAHGPARAYSHVVCMEDVSANGIEQMRSWIRRQAIRSANLGMNVGATA